MTGTHVDLHPSDGRAGRVYIGGSRRVHRGVVRCDGVRVCGVWRVGRGVGDGVCVWGRGVGVRIGRLGVARVIHKRVASSVASGGGWACVERPKRIGTSRGVIF